MKSLHGKKCYGNRIYITPVVAASPSKCTTAEEDSSRSAPLPLLRNPPSPPPAPMAGYLASCQVKLKLKTTRNLAPALTKFYDKPVVIIETEPASDGEDSINSDSPSSTKPNINRRKSVSEKRKPLESPDKCDQENGLKSDLKKTRKLRKKENQSRQKGTIEK